MTPALRVAIREKLYPAAAGQRPHAAIRDLAFAIPPGAFVTLSGPSGCGKTTLLNMIAGLDTAFDGTIARGGMVDGAEPRLSYMFQAPRLLPWRTVAENVALAAPHRRGTEITGLLDQMGLQGFHDAYPERLSIGMQRRAALARAFAVEPDLLLMDEPFVSLDDPTAERLRALLLATWNRRPTTVLFVTHDRAEAVRLGTRLLILSVAPATLVRDVPITLTVAERDDPARVAAARDAAFAGLDTRAGEAAGPAGGPELGRTAKREGAIP